MYPNLIVEIGPVVLEKKLKMEKSLQTDDLMDNKQSLKFGTGEIKMYSKQIYNLINIEHFNH
jgi:hypothetical protein